LRKTAGAMKAGWKAGMTEDGGNCATLLKALVFSAAQHRDQRRKDREASPYINHPIEVASVLANVGGVSEITTLVAAILHDTIEDTQTMPEEIEGRFGPEIRLLVEEVSDDKRLLKAERKRLQIEHAPSLSRRAKLIKLADKICNVRDVTHRPPAHWPLERRREYLDWTERVVAGCRGASPRLEQEYDRVLREGRALLGVSPVCLENSG
jgi:(p)ppGpp synthase/HD superfamily hydrolase